MEFPDKLYDQHYSVAKDELRKLGCNSYIFEDIYHEAFIVLIKLHRSSGENFRVNQWFVVQICKHFWYKEHKFHALHDMLTEIEKINEDDSELKDFKLMLLAKHMENLSSICREILSLYLKNFSEEKISNILNLEGPKAVNNRKFLCKEKLRELIESDPLFEDLYE